MIRSRYYRIFLDWVKLPYTIILLMIIHKITNCNIDNIPEWRKRTIPFRVVKYLISKRYDNDLN